jgi:hypothetical protein
MPWRNRLSLLPLALAAAVASAEDRPTVVVTDPSATAYRVALQTFADPGGDPARAASFRKALEDALAYSALFDLIDPKAFLGPVATASFDEHPTCTDWSQIRTDALVQGELRSEGQRVVAEYRVIDVARACRSLRRHRYRGGAGELDAIARRVADDIASPASPASRAPRSPSSPTAAGAARCT